MKSLSNGIVIALLAACMAGCASSKLTVSVDLFDTDPKLAPPPTKESAQKQIAGLNSIPDLAKSLHAKRVEYADGMMNLFAAYKLAATYLSWDPANPLPDESKVRDVSVQKEAYDVHIDGLRSRLRAVERRHAETVEEINQYIERYDQLRTDSQKDEKSEESKIALSAAWRTVREAAGALDAAIYALSRPFEDEFEGNLNLEDVTKFVQSYTAKIEIGFAELVPADIPAASLQLRTLQQQATKEFDAAVSTVEGLLARWEAQDELIINVAKSAVPAEALAQPAAQTKNLDSKVKVIVAAGTAADGKLKTRDDAVRALAQLIQFSALYLSQIDRLQDAADPVWRIVTSKENELRWHQDFVHTYFYSEGNNAVVIVRDSPMSFRVQRAENNPSALVESQLHIVRSIADSALAVAGAASGMPLTKMLPPSAKKTSAPDDTQTASAALDLSNKKADLEKREETISRLRSNLLTDLQSLRQRLDTASNSTDISSATRALDATLKNHKAMLDAALTEAAQK